MKRGEVFYLEGYGQRIGSPVDLQISVYDSTGTIELDRFQDEPKNNGNASVSTAHLDPSGRWVAPSDGCYLIMVRSLIGGLTEDPRRIYRLSIRREEPDFHLVVVPRQSPVAALNPNRGGRLPLDVIAIRHQGMTGPIRIFAEQLPEGVECPDVVLGPGVNQTSIVVSVNHMAPVSLSELVLAGTQDLGSKSSNSRNRQRVSEASDDRTSRLRRAKVATIVRSGTPTAWSRLASKLPLNVVGDSPIQLTADGHEIVKHHLYGELKVRHAPGGILDIAVQVDRRDVEHQAVVRLTSIGLPEMIPNQVALIPAGQQKGYLSFYLPPTLPIGRYTVVIQGDTTVPTADKKTESVTVYSSPVTFDVEPAAFLLTIDPFAPTRVKRGEVINVSYSSQRQNGFIGKMHTELAMPGVVTNVTGLRGRGETFVGQTDRGSLQIIVNDDAPLGPVPFLRLFTVGVVEDEPIYHGANFMSLEIVD
ncbi:MAG: hypothetical protein FJ267_01960 [Planctomycetes bacterium]|nr:hypothetical protein [Planctomycetota bacterium]